MRTRRLITLAGALLAAAVAAPTAAAAETLVWAIPGGYDEQQVYIGVARDFEKLHPGVTITTIPDKKQAELIAAGSSPDLVFTTIENFAGLQKQGVFLDLEPYAKASNFDAGDFFPPIINAYRTDGSRYGAGDLYGIPKEVSVRPIYYNSDLFKEAGLPDPNEQAKNGEWNWDNFLKATKRLAVDNNADGTPDRWGFAEDTWFGRWMPWIWENGGRIVDDAFHPTRSEFNSTATVEALDFFAKLRYSEHVFPPSGNTTNMFINGQLAMYANGRWKVPQFRNSAKSFTWDVAPRPTGPVARADLLTGSMWGVSSQSKDPKLAWELLTYVTSKEAQTKMTALGLLFPSRLSVAKAPVFLDSRPPVSNLVFIDSVAFAKPEPMNPSWGKIQDESGKYFGDLMAGKISAKEAALAISRIIDTHLQG